MNTSIYFSRILKLIISKYQANNNGMKSVGTLRKDNMCAIDAHSMNVSKNSTTYV